MLILLLKTQLLDLAGPELLEQGYRLGLIGEQVEVRLRIAGDLDCAVVNPVIDPVRRDPQAAGDLRHGQGAGDAARMGLAALAEQAMAQAKDADGAGQDGGVLGRAISSAASARPRSPRRSCPVWRV